MTFVALGLCSFVRHVFDMFLARSAFLCMRIDVVFRLVLRLNAEALMF